MIKIINEDSTKIFYEVLSEYSSRKIIVVSDPPFNIGYKYNKYHDRMTEDDYYNMLQFFFGDLPSVVIHYPEQLYRLSFQIGKFPERVISWVYNSNTPRQHRDIAFFDIKPDMNAVKQPYKNPNDKRIKERIANGCMGGKLYDWWNVNQTKNTSKDKTGHPCQMPLEVMKNIIGILPTDALIIDPFLGSGTTAVACVDLGRDCIGIEIDSMYCKIAKERLGL